MKLWIFMALMLLLCDRSENRPTSHENNTAPDDQHRQKEVVVFIYHRFGDNKYPSTNVSVADFEGHLNYLKTNGFKVLSFGQAVDYIADPSIPYQLKVACITVDDAFKSFFNNGYPLLKKYGFTASLFVNSETIGGGSFMNWDDIKKVADTGIEIGNHTHSHDYYLNIPVAQRHEQFTEEVKKCQEIIKQQAGLTPVVFAYPFGEFDNEMKLIIKSLGFKAAAAQFSGVMYDDDRFAIPRFPMTGSTATLTSFREKATMKALRLLSKSPDSPFLNQQNPPSLALVADTTNADFSRMSCFVSQGCNITIEGNTIKISAKNPLTSRRTNYTITAPAKSGRGWYWYTHQWVIPAIKE
ncbi:MAG: polysaccharide deacetylase family protein [Cyclobacteriaceae bacterium]|nr:polysaccharide deacetylase family protein [Cyclobacteriaceae bacterium]